MPRLRRMPLSLRALPLAAVLAFVSATPAAAQTLGGCDPDGATPSFMSAANEVFYGCQAMFRATPPEYFSAIGRFRSALERNPNDAVAMFLLGAAYAGYDKPDSARAVILRSLKLDPAVSQKLKVRFNEAPVLRDKIIALMTGTAAPTPVPTPVPTSVPTPVPGPTTPRLGGALVTGTYDCTYDTWVGPPAAKVRKSDPKGSLLMRADGTYRHYDNGANGRYRYDAATGAITWLTGDLADMRPEKTTFRRNQSTAQIDIRLKGTYEWSCGINLP